MGASAGGAARHSGSQARTSGLATGTAASTTVGITTSPAARPASGVVRRETSRTAAAVAGAIVMRVKCLGREVLEPAAAVEVAAVARGGELVTGFAPGQDAMSITLLADQTASGAMRQEIIHLVAGLIILLEMFHDLEEPGRESSKKMQPLSFASLLPRKHFPLELFGGLE